jgi:hypothetical protein
MSSSNLLRKLGARVEHQQCVPLLSQFVTSTQLFPALSKRTLYSDPFLAARWSKLLEYPMGDYEILPRVAQYAYVVVHQYDDFDAKISYLNFLKEELFKQAEERQLVDGDLIGVVRDDAGRMSVSDIAMTLGIVDLGPESNSPMSLLARMPFEVYLTTSPFSLLEEALSANGKAGAVSAYYQWFGQELSTRDVVVRHEPTVEAPLVYHLQGIEAEPVSMVLTEDDYFGFFKQLAQDLRNEVQSDNRLPPVISALLGSKSLLMLGYSLYDWSFRSFFRGPFRQSVNSRTRGLTAQFPPEGDEKSQEKVRHYLNEFFKEDKFDLYWGSVEQFTHDLMAELGG